MLATTPRLATASPLHGGTSPIPSAQETLYFTTPVTTGHQQRHDEVGGGEHYSLVPTTASRWVGNQDSRLSAGAAASIALRAQRPVGVSGPDIRWSAGRAAAMAAREVKSVYMQVNEPISFANSAAVLAHKAAKPATGTSPHPKNPVFPRSVIYGDEATVTSNMPPVIHNAAARSESTKAIGENLEVTTYIEPAIQSAAAKPASDSLPMAIGNTLEATEVPNKRRMTVTANLEEAARRAAARRLALLDQELYESGVLRRVPLPNYETETGQSGSPRRRYSMGEGASMRSGRARAEDMDAYINLLEVARRNVSRRLAGMDLQVADKKGLSYRQDWDDQAMRVAESRIWNTNGSRTTSEIRPSLHGKINVGGGRLVDAEEVERIALRNVQPVLEEITAKAEAERARVAAERAEAEEKKRLENFEREKNREAKEEKKQAKAAEKAEISRRKSEAKRERRSPKVEGRVDGLTTEQPSTNGTGMQTNARKMPPPPPQESKSKLRKLLGKLRRSTMPPPAETGKEKFGAAYLLERGKEDREGGRMPPPPPQESKSKLRKLLGKLRRSTMPPPAETGKEKFGAAYLLERGKEDREGGREMEMETVAGERGVGVDEVLGPQMGGTPARGVSLTRDATRVERQPLAVTTEARRDIESGEVFWDRVEYIDPEEYKRCQTEKHAPISSRLECTTLFRDELVPLDGADRRRTSPPPPSLRPTAPLQAQPICQLHLPSNSELKSEAAISARPMVDHNGPDYRHMVVPGEEEIEGRATERVTPLYDHPEHPIDVTVIGTVNQEEERTVGDMYSGQAPVSKGKSAKIEEPESGQGERVVEESGPREKLWKGKGKGIS